MKSEAEIIAYREGLDAASKLMDLNSMSYYKLVSKMKVCDWVLGKEKNDP